MQFSCVFLLGNEWTEKDACLCGKQWRSNRTCSVSECGGDPKQRELRPPHNTASCQPLSTHPTGLSKKSNQVNLTWLTSNPSQGSSGAAAALSLKH